MSEEYLKTNRNDERTDATKRGDDQRDKSEMEKAESDANRDPLSKRAGAHPVGTGVGAAVGGGIAGAAAGGAAIGAAAGPIGIAAGAVVGAVVGSIGGGLAGKAIAEKVNPTEEHGFWRGEYASRPYVVSGALYEQYAPAYQFGWESQAKNQGKTFDDVEADLQREWECSEQYAGFGWRDARDAARDSWDRAAERQAQKDLSKEKEQS